MSNGMTFAGEKRVMEVGWAAVGTNEACDMVALVLRSSRDGDELCFVMSSKAASHISTKLAEMAQMVCNSGGSA